MREKVKPQLTVFNKFINSRQKVQLMSNEANDNDFVSNTYNFKNIKGIVIGQSEHSSVDKTSSTR